MPTIPVQKGIQGIPVNTIPDDPKAFPAWFKSVYIPRWAALADVRNAIGATGITVTGTPGTPATITGTSGAAAHNPTAVIGLVTVNGTALTFMRSDAAPALNQGIAPTWTQQHVFT